MSFTPANRRSALMSAPRASRNGARRQALAVARLCQPAISLIAACYTLLGAYLVGGAHALFTPRVALAALVVALVVAYSFAINAYYDADVDWINEPSRPIPSGQVSRRVAGGVVAALALLAFVVSLGLGVVMSLMALANITLSALYSARLKSTVLVGNAVIGLLNGSVIVYGALAVGQLTRAVWLVALLVFMGTLAQEILYTVRDREGDANAHVTTIATRYGAPAAVRAFQVAACCFVAAAVLMWIAGAASTRYLIALIPCTMLPIAFDVALLGRGSARPQVLLALRVINAIWLTSLIPILFFR